MSDTPSRRVEILAPAKLNLGLEVIGRREDGYHELATIFLAVALYDRLTLTQTAAGSLTLTCNDISLGGPDNLALRALAHLRHATGHPEGAALTLHKEIPAAAGLGGASSDAAAALLAARELWRLDLDEQQLAALAAGLGSDVPFFLHGGCALGQGRGELLTPLPVPEAMTFVVVVPEVAIPHKTARLYAALDPSDFSDGSRIASQTSTLQSGRPLDPTLLANAFTRPLYTLVPSLASLPDLMRQCGAPTVALSGAGPAHYIPLTDVEEAERIARRLRDRLPAREQVYVTHPQPPR